MRARKTNPTQLDIFGNGNCLSGQEILAATLKNWRRKFAFCSMVAAAPAILVSHVEGARSDDKKSAEPKVVGQGVGRPAKLNKGYSTQGLLKRQSEFLLPHQKGNFAMLAPALAANDDCGGRAIPGGHYTSGAPYVDSANTTGADNTVTRVHYFAYHYYWSDVAGPDNVYTFTLTGLGPNPQIQIVSPSGSYQPAVYILDGRSGCPVGTGNFVYNELVMSTAAQGTATLHSGQMRFLPLNVPLQLFVDSVFVDAANGSGPYTLRMQDVSISPAADCSSPNPIDCRDFFVRQHYVDFLGRQPDAPGFAGWQNILENCGNTVSQPCDRIEVSSAFFRSSEFQGRGYFVYRFTSTLGRIPLYDEFNLNFSRVSGFQDEQLLESNKAAFVDEFISRPEFQNKYSSTFNHSTAYVDALLQSVGLPNHPSRQTWINTLNNNNSAPTRAQVLRQLVESAEVYNKYYNEAFVIMQYFGYLHRTADAAYLQWIQIMNDTGGDYRVMINGFLNSNEYRRRFVP